MKERHTHLEVEVFAVKWRINDGSLSRSKHSGLCSWTGESCRGEGIAIPILVRAHVVAGCLFDSGEEDVIAGLCGTSVGVNVSIWTNKDSMVTKIWFVDVPPLNYSKRCLVLFCFAVVR